MKKPDTMLTWGYCLQTAAASIKANTTGEETKQATYILNRLTFSVNERLTSTAGRATYNNQLVEISGPIFQQTYVLAQLVDTILHEIAHHLARHLDKERGHGANWVKWAELIGCSAERTHSMPRARQKTAQQEALTLASTLKL